jgi:hypothetical protein
MHLLISVLYWTPEMPLDLATEQAEGYQAIPVYRPFPQIKQFLQKIGMRRGIRVTRIYTAP